MTTSNAVHICQFALGWFRVFSPSGKQAVTFEDSVEFGPAKVDVKTGDIEYISDKHWFWLYHHDWVVAGRPVTGKVFPNAGWGFPIQEVECQ